MNGWAVLDDSVAGGPVVADAHAWTESQREQVTTGGWSPPSG
jgi:hypothetical protein